MKISWGIKIILSFVIFAAGIIIMVAISISKSTDLVSENYYEQEIKYQDQIDLLKNSREIEKIISLTYADNLITIKSAGKKGLKGEMHFYRTSNAAKDFKIDFSPDEKGMQTLTASNLDKGLWKVKMSLKDSSSKFFVEKSIFIN